MGRPRAFDWDEAARLYRAHRNYSEVGRLLGVSSVSIRRCLNPTLQAQQARKQKEERGWIGECIDCGGPASNRYASSRKRGGRCRRCAAFAASDSVRADTLRCSACRLWLPDGAFPMQSVKIARRGRHGICTDCGRVMKRDHRRANPEQEQAAYERRKAKRREAAAARRST